MSLSDAVDFATGAADMAETDPREAMRQLALAVAETAKALDARLLRIERDITALSDRLRQLR